MGDSAPTLIVCGTGPMEDWCRDFIANNKISNIEMRGFVPNNEAKKLIANSKALILPTQWYEGFPMTIVEAYSVGTPVIGSDLGNTGSVVEEGSTGTKFEYNSCNSLIEAVRRISNCGSGISSTTKTTYVEKYSDEQNYQVLEFIYKKAVIK